MLMKDRILMEQWLEELLNGLTLSCQVLSSMNRKAHWVIGAGKAAHSNERQASGSGSSSSTSTNLSTVQSSGAGQDESARLAGPSVGSPTGLDRCGRSDNVGFAGTREGNRRVGPSPDRRFGQTTLTTAAISSLGQVGSTTFGNDGGRPARLVARASESLKAGIAPLKQFRSGQRIEEAIATKTGGDE
ncbi:unnamed protein product [Protopolystoma xenopodis]|uniref:Uncharacterized protein n=1 Tax=Protopolystoma xenopodis TaxID=117903 RepID=A0A3S5ADZ5_9PLAT|nr:unnamed protein product [Protopolystoma xenopodis]